MGRAEGSESERLDKVQNQIGVKHFEGVMSQEQPPEAAKGMVIDSPLEQVFPTPRPCSVAS